MSSEGNPKRGIIVAGLDTAGDRTGITLLRNGIVVTEHQRLHSRKHAETLFPTLETLLQDCGAKWSDLASIGVGVGPGFFNGIRVAIAAARGLAIALQIPAVGLDRFAALTLDIPGPALAVLAMPDGRTCCRMTNETDAFFATPATIAEHCPRHCTVVGHDAAAFASRIDGTTAEPLYSKSFAVALAAHRNLGQASPRPVPCYVNPPRIDSAARRFARPVP